MTKQAVCGCLRSFGVILPFWSLELRCAGNDKSRNEQRYSYDSKSPFVLVSNLQNKIYLCLLNEQHYSSFQAHRNNSHFVSVSNLKNELYVICRPGGPFWEKLCQRSWVRPEAAAFPNTFFSMKENCWKRRESWKISSGPNVGSGWENPDRWSAHN